MSSTPLLAKTRRPLRTAGRAGLAFATLGASLVVGLTIASSPASAAAPAECLGTIYASDGTSGNIFPVTTAGVVGATAAYDATPGTATGPNQLGIGEDGAYAVNTTSVGGVAQIEEYTF